MSASNGLLMGVGRFDTGGGAAPSAVAWSTTDVAYPTNCTFTNGNLTVERSSNTGGSGNMVGRATDGFVSSDPTANVIFTIVVQSGFQSVGLANATCSLTAFLGNTADGIGYANTGEINRAGSPYTAGVSTYTSGDVITMIVDRGASTVTFQKNGVTQGTIFARDITSLGAGTLYPAWHSQSIGTKITGDFTAIP